MSDTVTISKKQLIELEAHAAALLKLASYLSKKSGPIQVGTARKGKKMGVRQRRIEERRLLAGHL